MLTASAANPTLDGYQLKLPMFEGPLDVLIRLIERDQLEISEISLLAVFDQFVSYMQHLDLLPPAVIAEFVAIAGRLSVLKSRALLPKPPRAIEDEDEPDLVRQLEEYRAVKAAAELLAERQRDGSGAFGRGDGVAWPEAAPAPFSPQPASALAKAVRRWLTRVPAKPVLLATQRMVSLREMIARISIALDTDRPVPFDTVRASCATRQDVAVAFLALLILLRRQTVRASQTDLFGSITMERAEADPEIMTPPAPIAPSVVNAR